MAGIIEAGDWVVGKKVLDSFQSYIDLGRFGRLRKSLIDRLNAILELYLKPLSEV